jgi:hypothetical protein
MTCDGMSMHRLPDGHCRSACQGVFITTEVEGKMACEHGTLKRGMFVAVLVVAVLGLVGLHSVWAAGSACKAAAPGAVNGSVSDPTDGSPIIGADLPPITLPTLVP